MTDTDRAALSTTPTMSAEDMREAAAKVARGWNNITRSSDERQIAREIEAAIRSLPLTKEPSQ